MVEHWTKANAERFAARNREIHRRHRLGESYAKLAAEYGFGQERARQIVASYDIKLLRAKYGPGSLLRYFAGERVEV